MPQQSKARIIGIGSYLPEKVLTNFDFEKMVETSDEWIVSRTGIQERRVAASEQASSDLGLQAALRAIEDAGIDASEIELIVTATMTPDYITPSTAALIQSRLPQCKAAAVDIQAACSGFLYGLSMVKAYVDSGMYKTVMLVATEKMSSFLDYKDRNTCVLFGDGAAAVVVSNRGAGLTINSVHLGADGSQPELIIIQGGGSRFPATEETVKQGLHYFKMNGKEVFKQAVKVMGSSAVDCIEKAGLKKDQVSWMIPHQANVRIMEAMAKAYDFPKDSIFKNLHKYGNTSGASIGIALDELMKNKEVKSGEHILLVAFGGGLTWGATILTKNVN